ncbi:uncharacterized protein LOC115481375 [Microcaecilia unicolor]|uniref:Uncharacterized protein LOC115481375 n=1 Tax=Microcaecilia unicolor TaxID=1415580 RepID=A0A6P7ZQ52_9AMPH|nr:uncharacterized protein LOC115481375 [Microcaecilia unicolor]XP_030076331.1 uncharacterized protein LOC115481375 [Microcaecilia unicolor]
MELRLRSRFLLLLTLTIALRLQTAISKVFFSHLEGYCSDTCKKSGKEFKCNIINQNGDAESQYCSPQEGLDYRGRECKDEHPCGKYGQDFYWCYLKEEIYLNSRAVCGLIFNDVDHFTSTDNMACKGECSARSTGAFQCDTGISHDYCSPEVNVDYYGRECRRDHPCGKYGENYHWCYLKRGSHEKCGMIEPKVVSHRTRSYGALCLGECLAEGRDYFWCETLRGWDYCSPLPDVTYRNVPCRVDHPCDLHGKSYYWCYTDNSWDYCGPVENNECAYTKVPTGKKIFPNSELICHDDRNDMLAQFIVQTAPKILSDSKSYVYEAHMMINRWRNDFLDEENTPQLLSSAHGKLHLDHKGFTNVDDIQYHDYQIQTTCGALIAQVLIPNNTNIRARYVRRALVESLYRRARITIRVQPFFTVEDAFLHFFKLLLLHKEAQNKLQENADIAQEETQLLNSSQLFPPNNPKLVFN